MLLHLVFKTSSYVLHHKSPLMPSEAPYFLNPPEASINFSAAFLTSLTNKVLDPRPLLCIQRPLYPYKASEKLKEP